MKRAIQEVQKRLIIGLPNWKVKVVDKDGVREVELALFGFDAFFERANNHVLLHQVTGFGIEAL